MTSAKDAVEAEAEFRRLNFLGVARAHRRDHGRVVDAALQKTDSSPVFELIQAEQVPPQVQTRQPVRFEEPLIREIVNGKDARRAAKHGMRRVERAQIDRRKARLPVVGVNDERRRRAASGEFERGAREKAEAPCVVYVVGVADAVERVAIVELGTIDE